MMQLRHRWEVDVTVSFVDDQGDAAAVESTVGSTDDPAVLAIVATSDPLVWTVQAIGAVGSTLEWAVQGDADLGEGVVPVVVHDQIQIVSGQAVSGSATYGEPRPMV